jgi:hypothetical protein
LETINIYKVYKGYSKFKLYSGLVYLVFGAVILIKYLFFKNKPVDSFWELVIPVIVVLQGLLFSLQGYYDLKHEKIFIRWDEHEIVYKLWKDKATETIRIADIRKVTYKLMEIRVQLPETEKILYLEGIQYKDLQRLKEKFEVIISQIK